MDLIPEIILHIFSFLNPHNLSQCARVSSYWYYLSQDNSVWKEFCSKYIVGNNTIEIFNRFNLRYECYAYKKFYQWLHDLKFNDSQFDDDTAKKVKYDYLKREYIYCRAIDLNNNDMNAQLNYALFLKNLRNQ